MRTNSSRLTHAPFGEYLKHLNATRGALLNAENAILHISATAAHFTASEIACCIPNDITSAKTVEARTEAAIAHQDRMNENIELIWPVVGRQFGSRFLRGRPHREGLRHCASLDPLHR